MPGRGRPKIEFDEKAFQDLVGLGCTEDEICWYFRDESGRVANADTLSRWCKRTFGLNFRDYFKKNGLMYAKIALRRNQLALSKKSAAMAIFLGKQWLDQTEKQIVTITDDDDSLQALNEYLDRENGVTA